MVRWLDVDYSQFVNRPTAVIDKSMLQAICGQSPDKLDACFNTLFGRYVLVVPSILVEEVWVNRANPSPGKPREVVENMVECLVHLRDAWIEEPLEIAFVEMIERQPIEVLPKPPPSVMNSFSTLPPDNPGLAKWANQRWEMQKKAIEQRLQEQSKIFDTNVAARVGSEREFFDLLIRPKFLDMLADSGRKRNLLELVLGVTFRARYPRRSRDIDAAFEDYSVESFEKYQATFYCIMSAMFYFYAPLCKIEPTNGGARKLLGRGRGAQRSNLNDEKYVQSALLCARLATRDEGMRNVMELFRACGLWKGETIFVCPNSSQDLAVQISGARK